jgi:hypothetical protein
MNKKFILFMLLILIMFLGLTSCTMAGTELGLVGKWKYAGTYKGLDFVYNIEIKYDDTGTGDATSKNGGSIIASQTYTFKITKADSINKTIDYTATSSGISTDYKYKYTLTYNELTWDQSSPTVQSSQPNPVKFIKQ